MTLENLDTPALPATAQQFSPYVAEHLLWYVYALRDPRDQRVFYIGKGRGNRVFQHAKAALAVAEGSEVVSTRITQILDIIAAGLHVDAIILRHGIASEKAAYEVEAAIIDTLRLLDPALANDRFQLANLVLGHHHATKGLVNADVVASLYDAPQALPIVAPSILFRIPTLWTPQMSSEELYEVTRGWWVIGPNPRAKAEYAFAVSKGVVRGIYRITSWRERQEGDRDWEQDLGKKPRWGFEGEPASEMSGWLNTSVAHLFKKGEANPVKVVNLSSRIEPERGGGSNSFTLSDDGVVLELIRLDADGLSVRRNRHWVRVESTGVNPTIDGPQWIDVTADGAALWDKVSTAAAQLSRADAWGCATETALRWNELAKESPAAIPVPAPQNEPPTTKGSGKPLGVTVEAPSTVATVEWLRRTGSLDGVDPWDGAGWSRYVPLLWALRPSFEDLPGFLPPDPRTQDGTSELVFLAPWWTPLLHLTRFQMGLGRPGSHLAWLRSDPAAAAAHSPLTGVQFALMDKWWGAEAVEDFIAWAIFSEDQHPTVGGIWPSDEAVPKLSERQALRYQLRTESARWQATWGGGSDPMHLSDHAMVPFKPNGRPSPINGPQEDPPVRSAASPLHAALTPGWRPDEHSNLLHLLSPDYAGWYGELLAHGRVLSRQTPVKVVIMGFGPLGTFEIGAGRRPRLIAYPKWSVRYRAFMDRMVWTRDQVTITPPPPTE